MKKNNKTLRVAAVLAVGALLSTCLVSGTFAKYTTSGSSSDSARVAKWGVVVDGKDASGFKETYNGGSVKATAKVVAPGTTDKLTAAKVTGNPEVKVQVKNTAEVKLENWTVGEQDTFYCPLTFQVAGKDVTISADATKEQIIQAVQTAVSNTSKTYEVGESIEDAAPSVTWSWAFDGNDTNDTLLGNKDTAPTISIKVTTQIDQVQ